MEYPECENMAKVRPQSDIIGEFLGWLQGKKEWEMCEYQPDEPGVAGGYCPVHFNTEELLAEFFNIDLKKVEEERRQMLDEIRKKDEAKIQRGQPTNNSP